MGYKKIIIISALFVFILAGCGKNETEDDGYKSLSDLLATERSVENDESMAETSKNTEADTISGTMADNTKENVTEKASTSPNGTLTENETNESHNDETSYDKQTADEIVPLPAEADANSEQSEPETIIVYKYVEVPATAASVTHFYSDSYNTASNSLVFSPREIYYNNGVLYATMYVYNGHATTADNIKNVTLTFSNGDTIASAVFDALDGCTIAPHSYVLWNFTFPSDGIFIKNAEMSSINTTYKCNYSY